MAGKQVPSERLYTVRIHLDGTTQDIQDHTWATGKSMAESVLRNGVWVANRLYPPSTIVMVELIAQP